MSNILITSIFYIALIFPSIGYSQFCLNSVVPPTTINIINVTATSTGSVSNFSSPFTSCGIYTSPANSVHLGRTGAFTYTMNFSFPVNNLDFVITAAGEDTNEVFTFSTNVGIPSIIDQGSCFTTIANNVLTSGQGANNMGSGGHFTIANTNPFTTLIISGVGGSEGSLLAICDASVVTEPDIRKEICLGDSLLIGNKYRKISGIYLDTILGGNSAGGDSILIVDLTVRPIPIIDLGEDTTLCQNDKLILNATTSGATYLWQDSTINPTMIVTQEGIYWTSVKVNNCIATDTIRITYNPLNSINLGNDTTLCQDEIMRLDATTPNATYQWQDSTVNNTFNVSKQGIFWTVVTVDNCFTSDTIIVNYNPLPIVNLGNDTTLCYDDTMILDVTASNAIYLWQDNSTNSTFTINKSDIYWVSVTLNNCHKVDSLHVTVRPRIDANLGNDTSLCEGDILTLETTTPNANYLWNNSSTKPQLNITSGGVFHVKVSINECFVIDTITIDQMECPTILEMPNIITPNNDGINDFFTPIAIENIVSMHTTIYNRWGIQVYVTDDILIQWNGSNINDGVYFWAIEYLDNGLVKKRKAGILTVVR